MGKGVSTMSSWIRASTVLFSFTLCCLLQGAASLESHPQIGRRLTASDEWSEEVEQVETGTPKVYSHVLAFSKIEVCIQGLTKGPVDQQWPAKTGTTVAMATDQTTDTGVPIANRGKVLLSCAMRGYDYKSEELSELLLGTKETGPEGVGVFAKSVVVQSAQATLALGLGGSEAKVCLTFYDGPDCSGNAQPVETAQHRCNSKSTIFPAQTGQVSISPAEAANGMVVQCVPSESSNRRLLGRGERSALHEPSIKDFNAVEEQIAKARAIANEFRREAQLKSATEYAKTLNAANTEETGDRLSDQGSKCSYEQESAEGAASRTLQGTSSQQAGCGVVTSWTPAGEVADDQEPANICSGVFDSREGFELQQCTTFAGKPCGGATGCIKVQCNAC